MTRQNQHEPTTQDTRSLMIENHTKAKLAAGETVLGCFFKYPEPTLAEYIAMQGWDFMIFDGEHGSVQSRDVEDLCRAVEIRGVTPITRATSNQAHIILRFLDAGCHGQFVEHELQSLGVEGRPKVKALTPIVGSDAGHEKPSCIHRLDDLAHEATDQHLLAVGHRIERGDQAGGAHPTQARGRLDEQYLCAQARRTDSGRRAGRSAAGDHDIVSFFDRNPTGRLMARVESDTEALRRLFTNTVVSMVGAVLLVAGMFVWMFIISPRLKGSRYKKTLLWKKA